MANTLFLRLEGPLQAWGERAKWSIRDTAAEPTKSGVIGLIGCAMGFTADEDLAALSRKIKIGVRCDRPGTLLRDFHTIIGGVLSAEGKIKDETVVSVRSYISDGSFLVAVRSDLITIGEISIALQSTKWPFFLGRKSCVPARPVFAGNGDFLDLISALKSAPYEKQPGDLQEKPELRSVIETTSAHGVQRRDELLSHSSRTFLPRYVEDVFIAPENIVEELCQS